MGFACGFSALGRSFFRFRSRISEASAGLACLLIVLLAFPPGASAKAGSLTAAAVHERILKRGIDNPVGVELNNGIELVGRIIAINSDSFSIQLLNDPEPVTVNYADVVDLRTGPNRGFWVFTGVAIGAAAGFAIWGFVHVHNLQQQKLPGLPIVPAVP